MSTIDPGSMRRSIEARLANRAAELGIDIGRLRRHFVFQRMLVRLGRSDHWVLKGGFALESRLLSQARATKDLDLAILDVAESAQVREKLIEALELGDTDSLSFVISRSTEISPDVAGNPGWRFTVDASMAGRVFASLRLDIVARPAELDGGTETIVVRSPIGSLSDAEITAVDLAQHAAEKLHALTRTYGDRVNTRVKDLVDIVLLHETGLLDADRVADRVRVVHEARDGSWPPETALNPPASWAIPYAELREELGLHAEFEEAVTIAAALLQQAIQQGDST